LERLGCFLVEPNVAQDLALEIVARSKEATVKDVPLELTEPALDLVEPGRIGGREVPVPMRMPLKEPFDQFRFVRRAVVQDDVNLVLDGWPGDDLFQKRNQLRTGVAGCGWADPFTGLRIQGRLQREGAVAVILEAVRLCAPGG